MRVVQRCEHREIGCSTRCAGVGREIKQHHAPSRRSRRAVRPAQLPPVSPHALASMRSARSGCDDHVAAAGLAVAARRICASDLRATAAAAECHRPQWRRRVPGWRPSSSPRRAAGRAGLPATETRVWNSTGCAATYGTSSAGQYALPPRLHRCRPGRQQARSRSMTRMASTAGHAITLEITMLWPAVESNPLANAGITRRPLAPPRAAMTPS